MRLAIKPSELKSKLETVQVLITELDFYEVMMEYLVR